MTKYQRDVVSNTFVPVRVQYSSTSLQSIDEKLLRDYLFMMEIQRKSTKQGYFYLYQKK